MDRITLIRPDDWHLHLRDGEKLAAVLAHTAQRFGRAIVMPNLKSPVTTTELARGYRQRIIAALPKGSKFEPLMTLYLTDNTPPGEIAKAKSSGIVFGVKLYPAGATTHSDAGVRDIAKCYGVLEKMEEAGLPLLVHGEITDPEVDVFDREKIFIERILAPVVARFQKLKVVFEHITTKDAVQFVLDAPARVGATITAHHLLLSRNAMFQGGIHPHLYCLPVLKREEHRRALVAAVSGGKVFLGADSAPTDAKTRRPPAAAGITPRTPASSSMRRRLKRRSVAVPGRLCQFPWRRLLWAPRNDASIALEKREWTVPELSTSLVTPWCHQSGQQGGGVWRAVRAVLPLN